MNSELKDKMHELYPHAELGFIDILIEALELSNRKSNDYQGKNFVQEYDEFHTIGKFHDIKRKYDRLYNKVAKKTEYQVDESLEDTAIDLGNYAFLFLLYIRNMKKGN